MPSTIYTADPPDRRLLVPLDAHDAIYHRESGITHIVASPVPEILAALEQGPAGAETIVERLRATHDFSDEDAVAVIAARLEELESVGLVWRA